MEIFEKDIMAKRILLIDDDQEEADIFRNAVLEADDTAIFHHAGGCLEALHLIKEKMLPVPALIFLDINMPEINGLDCLKTLKRAEPLKHIPVVIYSTSSNPADTIRALNLGALAYWTKPNKYRDLLKKIQDLIHSALFV
jgi:CheY-like chemotaxis protein